METRKLIVLDIDGMPYRDKKQLAPATRAALIAAQERGHVLALTSGRSTADLSDLAEELEMGRYHGLLLSYGGGMVTECTSGDTLYSKTIPISTARALTRHLEGFPAILIVDDGQALYTDRAEASIVAHESCSSRLEVKIVPSLSAAITSSPMKILIFMPLQKMMKYRADIDAPFIGELSFSLSSPSCLEATPFGVKKANSLKKICTLLSIPQKDIVTLDLGQKDDIVSALGQPDMQK